MRSIALVTSATNNKTTDIKETFEQLAKRLTDVKKGTKDGTGWIPSTMTTPRRKNENAQEINYLVLDLEAHAEYVLDEKGKRTKDEFGDDIKRVIGEDPIPLSDMVARIEIGLGWRAVLHSSYSNTAEHPRYRIVLDTTRPMLPHELKPVGLWVVDQLDIANCYDKGALGAAAQFYYLPRCPSDDRLALFECVTTEGDPLDVDAVLNAVNSAPLLAANEPINTAPPVPAKQVYEPSSSTYKGDDEYLLSDLKSALDFIDEDDRAEWVAVGHALKTLGTDGFNLWMQWSQRSSKWQPDDVTQWFTFKPNRTGYKSIFNKAKDNGWINAATERSNAATRSMLEACSGGGGGDTPEPSKKAMSIVKKAIAEIRQTIAPVVEDMTDADLMKVLKVQPIVLDLMINQTVRHSNTRGVVHVLTQDGRVNNHAEQKCWSHLVAIHGEPFSQKELTKLVDEFIESHINPDSGKGLSIENQKALHKAMANPMRESVLWQIEHSNQVISQSFCVDRFIDTAYIEITEAEAHYTLPHVEFSVKSMKDRLSGDYSQDLISEYMTHFEQFDELIDQIAASLFTDDKKEAYNWLQAQSNAGKGMLQAAFDALGMVTTISVQELDACMIGAPVGKQPHMFTRSCILWINELKKITGNVKMLENSLSITPKFQSESRVELYVKMFTSAEDVPSLINSFGSEEQLLNRFSKLSMIGKVTDLSWFKKLGKDVYRRHLSDYIMKRMNASVAYYRSLGRDKASLEAANVLRTFHDKHGLIQHGKNLTESLHEIADDFLLYLYDVARNYRATAFESTHVVSVDEKSAGIGLRAPLKNLKAWLDSEYDQSELGQVNWKHDELLRLISHDGKGEVVRLPTGKRHKVIILRPKP